MKRFKLSVPLAFVLLFSAHALSQPLHMVSPEKAGMDPARLAIVNGLIESSIEKGETPGAVLLIVRDSLIVHRKAYGWMQLEPEPREMTLETIFDLASLTKPLATATAAMMLVERGWLRLTDPISDYVPEYSRFGAEEGSRRDQPRVKHLLTHTAGLPSYASVGELNERYGENSADSLMTWLCAIPKPAAPGTSFNYSCPSFITLQQVVESVTGTDMDSWTRRHLFGPLGMSDTFFLPQKPEEPLASRIAPTVYTEEEGVISGIVHDPLAREVMRGISGNAGLFSTGDDLALFAAMMLNKGEINRKRVLSPAAVRTMTAIPEEMSMFGRALGWDNSSRFASNQGDLFGKNAYGHTGYTGTSMIIDPDTRTAIILLTNRVYPDDSTSVVDLRAKIANVVAGSIIK